MTRTIFILFIKSLIGGLVIGAIIYAILKLCKYIIATYGEIYGFLSFIAIAIIIGVVCNKINKKRKREYLELNEEEKTK